MSQFDAVIEDKAAFERALDTPLPVFVVFMSHTCPACTHALPRFTRMAEHYRGKIKALVLECENTPRHPSVTGIPMLLVYHHNMLLKTLPGLGEQALAETFSEYAQSAAL